MKFWDSSAIVPLLVEESTTAELIERYREDPVLLAWWGAEIECASALERTGGISPGNVTEALKRLGDMRSNWQEVQPVDAVKETAVRLLRVHNLRAADSLQLAAAIVASENRPSSLDFVCLDDRLTQAAQREGFNAITLQPENGGG